MYCRNCGNQMDDQAVICVKCGVAKNVGSKFCPNCGAETMEDSVVCVNCGVMLKQHAAANGAMQKSKLTAGLLGIFLGWAGVHNFYLGYTAKGIIQVVLAALSFITCGVTGLAASIWGLVEGILILTGSTITADANGVPLKE